MLGVTESIPESMLSCAVCCNFVEFLRRKVVMASSREEGCVRDYGNEDDDDKLKRLFIVVPKTYNDVELREEFEVHGEDVLHYNYAICLG